MMETNSVKATRTVQVLSKSSTIAWKSNGPVVVGTVALLVIEGITHAPVSKLASHVSSSSNG
jgi:hypothetical protein